MTALFRVYLRTFDGQISEKTSTADQDAAATAFEALVNHTELDGQKMAVALTYENRQRAFHRFDRQPGDMDYWRDRLDEVEWPGTSKRGRKPVPPDARKDARVELRVHPDTKAAWQAKADAAGLSLAAWIEATLSAAKK